MTNAVDVMVKNNIFRYPSWENPHGFIN